MMDWTGKSETKSVVPQEQRITWPDLSKDRRAEELAKVAMGWSKMTDEQKMKNVREMLRRAQEIKETL